jgi:hypothetical protein
MKHSLLFSIAAIAALAIVCSRDMPVVHNPVDVYPGSGKFGISHVQGLAKVRSASPVNSEGQVGFELGSVKGSSTFYFLLYNVGFSPITDISIAFADSHFTAFPARMDTLFPGIDIGLLPIVKINAAHGTALNGVGSRPLLAMGNDTAVLTIKGKTRTKEGADSTLTLNANMSVRALVMDIDIQDSRGSLALASPDGRAHGNFPEGLYEMPFYSAMGCTVTVKNTGNVPVAMKVWFQQITINDTTFGDTLARSIDVGGQAAIPCRSSRLVFSFDGNNTISDQSRLPLLSNGKCYFCLQGDKSCFSNIDSAANTNEFISIFYQIVNACPNVKCRFFLIDNTMVFWELSAEASCKFISAGSRIYRLYGKTPDELLGSYKGEKDSYWTIEHYESVSAHGMLDTIRANLSANDLGLGKSHNVVLIIQ